MNFQEYKERKVHLTFPSGLELDINPPSAIDLLETATQGSGADTMLAMLRVVGKGFPAEFSVTDLNDAKDVSYLMDYVNSFFGQVAQPDSPPNSSSS